MSQTELYQSILLKLGHLPSASLAEVDAFLSEMAKKNLNRSKRAHYKTRLAQLAGAWKNWDEHEFVSFLESTRQTRQDMFADRNFPL